MLNNAPHPNAGKLLIEFLCSPAGQRVFRDAGYLPANPAVPPKTPELVPGPGGPAVEIISPALLMPGVTAVPLPGHTPGHTGYLVESGGASLLIWGDIVHVQELQVPRPEVTMAVDVDPAQAVATRRAILDRVATERLGIAGMHLHFPAFAHVIPDHGGYRLLPEPWSMDLAGDASV